MSSKENSQEQRRYKRHSTKSGAFALLKSGDLEILGSVKDISSDGICLTHIDENREFNDSPSITVNLITENIYYENFPSKNLWAIEEEGKFVAARVKMRRRGIQFTELTQEKQLQLDEFIKTTKK